MLSTEQKQSVKRELATAAKSIRVPVPMTLSEHAEEHFYLSRESSYIEGGWKAYPYQKGIMDLMSNDDVRLLVVRKSARVGYTKMLLACILYMAHHQKRNQCIWQPVDDDADDFVKSELDTMIRDVPAIREIFPYYEQKCKQNTLRLKSFLGSNLYVRGGKAEKNYRRISPSVCYTDETEAFDRDIEGFGDPGFLINKRLEGAVLPKLIHGSTPRLKEDSLIEAYADSCQIDLRFYVPCVHCDEMHPLTWGCIKFDERDPKTARAVCPHCEQEYEQRDYLEVWDRGRWVDTDETVYLSNDARFRQLENNEIVDTPDSVAVHIWTAYSPQATWAQIVREFFEAKGDSSKMKAWVNTTLGESWEGDAEKASPDLILGRREVYPADVPQNAIVLTAGVDTQNDRFEVYVMGWGEGEECWMIDAIVAWGDPDRLETQQLLDKALQSTYLHESGARLGISAVCIDSGGHKTQSVYQFCSGKEARRIVPIKGRGGESVPILGTKTKQSVSKGMRTVLLYTIGVDSAKNTLLSNVQIDSPGAGYIHVPLNNPLFGPEFAAQLTGEAKQIKKVRGFAKVTFVQTRDAVEAADCWVYGYAALKMLNPNLMQLKHDIANAVNDDDNEAVSANKRQPIKRRKGGYL